MKKILLLIISIFFWTGHVNAKEKINVYIFTKAEEPICEQTLNYFSKLSKEYGEYFEYKEYEVWDSQWKEYSFNRELAENVAKKFKDEIIGAPYIVIGNKYRFDEFSEDLKDEIKAAILDEYNNKNYLDIVKDEELKLKNEKSKEGIYIGTILMGISSTIIVVIFLSRRANKNK